MSSISPEVYRAWLQLLVDGNQTMVRVWGGGIYVSRQLCLLVELFLLNHDRRQIFFTIYVMVGCSSFQLVSYTVIWDRTRYPCLARFHVWMWAGWTMVSFFFQFLMVRIVSRLLRLS